VKETILAVDLGAGSLRAGAIDAAGRCIASASVPIRVSERQPGHSEIDPEVWWRALRRSVARVLREVPRSARVRGLCLSGLTRCQVLLDREARPLRPALLFRDRRSAGDAADVAKLFRAASPADAITAFHPLARLAWMRRTEPDLFRRVAFVLEPKDFLNWRLTGTIAADSVTYSRFDALPAAAALPGWLARSLAFLAIERRAPWALLGPVTCRAAPFDRLAGLPVFAGAMDTWTAATGSGAVAPGQAYDIAGTSEAVGLLTRKPAAVAGLVSVAWGEATHQIGGPTQVGADSAVWCHETFRVRGRLAQAVERAGRIAPSMDLPLLLPYLAGERVPLWRSDIRGAFHGVSREHGADAFLWATLEGVAHAVRDILSIATAGAGEPLAEVRVSGGGARSDAWCQLKADVTGVRFVRAAHAETGLVGSAMAAAVGMKWFADLEKAAQAMCPVDRAFEPRVAFAPIYARRAELYQRAKATALALAGTAARPGAAVL
jgi:xylulokinase